MKQKCWGAAICTLFFFFAHAKGDVRITQGFLDLSQHSWQADGTVNLSGDWEFYWGRFYAPSFFTSNAGTHAKMYSFVPSFWNSYIPKDQKTHNGFGFATYRLVINCPSSGEQLALKFLTVESAYRLYVNGEEILNVGHADTSAGKTVANLKPGIVRVSPENGVLDIVIHVSNFQNRTGGLWDVVSLGTEEQLRAKFIDNISLAFFVAGCFFFAGIYYLIIFFPFKNRYTLIYFSLLCFVILIRLLVTGEMPILCITNFDWAVARRLEYVSLFFTVPIMCLFSYYLFPQDFHVRVLYFIVPVSVIFIITGLFAPYYYYTAVIRYYQLLILLTTLYGLYVYVKAVINKRHGSLLFLIGFCVFLIMVVNDILNAGLIIHTVPLFYVGLAFFAIMLSIILSKQFYSTFTQLQAANASLSEKNNELGIMNNAISEKNTELKKINIEMDSFVNRTSHDLRAPLTTVLGINRMAKDEKQAAAIEKYLVMQEKTLIRMDRLINDIIDFSKNKRLELELKEINFESIINNAMEDHAYLSGSQSIKKHTEIKQFEKFISDPRRISIIINNLLSNAIKYADYTKELQEIHISILVADNMATIEISDNGIGIEERHLDKIFILFYRITNSTTGSGLGLYIVKETVEKLGGYIIINSRKGDGTSIKVIIPNIGYKL